MAEKILLLMDNIPPHVEGRAKLLELYGYTTLHAYTIREARKLLETRRIHLAVFDIRMEDDEDPDDISGLLFAQEPVLRGLPKIILTGHGSVRAARAALLQREGASSATVNFIGKDEDPKLLIEAIAEAFSHHVKIKWDLGIRPRDAQALSLTQSVRHIRPDLEADKQDEFARELEDLIRKLFYSYDAIVIDRMFWREGGKVAFGVTAFPPEKNLLVVCGKSPTMAGEESFANAPKFGATTFESSAETLHFTAGSYVLHEARLSQLRSFKEVYKTSVDPNFGDFFDTLFNKRLAIWSQDSQEVRQGQSFRQFCMQRLQLTPGSLTGSDFRRFLQRILGQSLRAGASLKRENGRIILHIQGLNYSYPDPSHSGTARSFPDSPLLLQQSPGVVRGENILTDDRGNLWLTNFAGAGMWPPCWQMVALESEIRYDWNDTTELQRLHGLENQLVFGFFSRLEPQRIDLQLRKAMRAIQEIRLIGTKTKGHQEEMYQTALFYQAVGRLIRGAREPHLTLGETVRQLHLLLSAAMLSERLMKFQAQAPSGLHIDPAAGFVTKNGVRVPLKGQLLKLLKGFHANPGRVCTPREIIVNFLGDRYHEKESERLYNAQSDRLYTNISRLRERIEDNPRSPRYLLTDGDGYRFEPDPNS